MTPGPWPQSACDCRAVLPCFRTRGSLRLPGKVDSALPSRRSCLPGLSSSCRRTLVWRQSPLLPSLCPEGSGHPILSLLKPHELCGPWARRWGTWYGAGGPAAAACGSSEPWCRGCARRGTRAALAPPSCLFCPPPPMKVLIQAGPQTLDGPLPARLDFIVLAL